MGFFDFLKKRFDQEQTGPITATDSSASIDSQAIPIAQSLDSNPPKIQEFQGLSDSSDSAKRFNRFESLPREMPKEAKYGNPTDSSDSNHLATVVEKVDEVKSILLELDRYIREKVAREMTVEQLIQAIQTQLPSTPTARSDLEAMKRLSENHKKLLAILIHDPATYYDYQQLADMTRLSADGVRGMISELAKMGYQFSVFRGEPVQPDDRAARERLVRYLLHPPFALDRLHYDSHTGTVSYHPEKKGSDRGSNSDSPTISSALDWLAAVVTHIPNKGQQLVRFYG